MGKRNAQSTEPPGAAEQSPPRACYCASLSPEFLREQKIPEGFCGICERCGQPGHTQHFPGPVPYTGSWCDRCVRIVAIQWQLKRALIWGGGILIFGLIVANALRR